MPSQKIEFQNRSGVTLAARLDTPEEPAKAWAVFAHCFSCSKDIFAASRIAGRLTGYGVGVLRFDFTGLGASEGDFGNTNFAANLDDLRAALDYVRTNHGTPALLIGHSLGGAAAAMVAAEADDVAALVTIGSPADAVHVRENFKSSLEELEANGRATIQLAGRAFEVSKSFMDDLEQHDVEKSAAKLKAAYLCCHAPLDEIVSIENATRLFVAAKHPKSFLSLDQADHLLTKKDDALYAADVIAAWGARYVRAALAPPPEAVAEAPVDKPMVVVRETRRSKFENTVATGRHVLLADEPESFGGMDHGPSPYQMLAAALGACTNMTLRLYADRKGWPLDRVTVGVDHAKEHMEDCEGCEDNDKAKIDVFTRTLSFEGPLDDDQRARLVEIADKCPVHRTLESNVVIKTSLEGAPALAANAPQT